MPVIKETIKQNNLDVTLKINLGSGINLSGFQQEIDNLTELTKDELINPIIDNEVRRFQYKSENGAVNLTFYFSNTPQPLFSHAGFSPSEIIVGSPIITNSFFIMDYYDTYDSYTQTKIFSTYLTQILSGVNKQPNYKIYSDTINQFYNWYVPLSFINSQTGSTIIGYTNFSFYNAKFGKVTLFFNKDNENILTPEKMYFKTELDLINKTWRFLGLPTNNANAYEISSTSAYVTRINNTIGNFVNTKQTYPTGNTFQTTTGTYVTE